MRRWYVEQMGPEYGPWKIVGFYHTENAARAAKRRFEKKIPIATFRTRSEEVTPHSPDR